MKSHLFILKGLSILSLFFVLLAFQTTKAQCKVDSVAKVKALRSLSKNGFRLSKSYRVRRTCKGCNNFRNYTVIMTRGNIYTLVIVGNEEGAKGIVANFKELSGRVIASNYDANSRKFYTSITFVCNRTAPYYLNFFPKDSNTSCGMAFLGFKINRN